MSSNISIIGEEAALRQLITGDFTETNGILWDEDCERIRSYGLVGSYGSYSMTIPLTKIILPNIIEILDESVRNHSQLKLIYLGKINTIRGKSLALDSSLITIILPKSIVCSLASVNAFEGTKYATNGAGGAYIYVPRDLISSYQAATNWATLYAAHPDMFRPLEDYTVDGTTTGEFDEALIATPQTPLYVVTDLDVSPDVEHPRTITTTAEGHMTLESGECSTEKWGYVWATDAYIDASK